MCDLELSSRRKYEKNQWYVNIFDDMGKDWEAIVNMRDTERETDFIGAILSQRGLVLDLCCGTGRHSIGLCRRGWKVVGMDLSKKLLSIAKMRVDEAKVKFPLVRADMRYFPFRDRVFAAIINMFTSFGYLPSETEDLKCLLEINRTLKNNGKFLLDLASRDHIVRGFRERDWAEFEPYYLLEKRLLDMENSKLISHWTIIRKGTGETRSIVHEVRLYTLNQLHLLLSKAGLAIREVYGGYDNEKFDLEASRMIALAKKPIKILTIASTKKISERI